MGKLIIRLGVPVRYVSHYQRLFPLKISPPQMSGSCGLEHTIGIHWLYIHYIHSISMIWTVFPQKQTISILSPLQNLSSAVNQTICNGIICWFYLDSGIIQYNIYIYIYIYRPLLLPIRCLYKCTRTHTHTNILYRESTIWGHVQSFQVLLYSITIYIIRLFCNFISQIIELIHVYIIYIYNYI